MKYNLWEYIKIYQIKERDCEDILFNTSNWKYQYIYFAILIYMFKFNSLLAKGKTYY